MLQPPEPPRNGIAMSVLHPDKAPRRGARPVAARIRKQRRRYSESHVLFRLPRRTAKRLQSETAPPKAAAGPLDNCDQRPNDTPSHFLTGITPWLCWILKANITGRKYASQGRMADCRTYCSSGERVSWNNGRNKRSHGRRKSPAWASFGERTLFRGLELLSGLSPRCR